MQFGVHLPHLGQQADGPSLARFARHAEALGYHSGWVSDHVAWPAAFASRYPYSADGSFPAPNNLSWLDPLGTLTYVAACTETLKLGTTVLILGYRPPVETAKRIATLDVLSGGRTILGVGVGWMREEFEVLGMPFDHRGARADEQLELFEQLFTQPVPSYDGRFYQVPEIGFQPKPVNGHIPIWVGGDTEPAFQRTVRFGDCFHAAFTPKAALRAQWARVQQLATEAGRDPASIEFSVRLFLDFGGRPDPEKAVQGEPREMIEQVAAYEAMGVTHLLLDITARGGIGGREDAMERFAREVMPHVGLRPA